MKILSGLQNGLKNCPNFKETRQWINFLDEFGAKYCQLIQDETGTDLDIENVMAGWEMFKMLDTILPSSPDSDLEDIYFCDDGGLHRIIIECSFLQNNSHIRYRRVFKF